MKILLNIGIAVALLASAAFADIQPARSAFDRKVATATFLLYGNGQLDDTKYPLCTATAFEQTKGGYHLLTASHCVMPPDVPNGTMFAVTEDITDSPVFQSVTVLQKGSPDGYDFAILDLKTDKKYPVVPLGDESTAHIGEPIVVVGFSGIVAKQTTYGTISSGIMTTTGDEGECSACKGRFTIQMNGGPGLSGAAAISEKSHTIVGIVRGGYSTIGTFVTPISQLAKLRK